MLYSCNRFQILSFAITASNSDEVISKRTPWVYTAMESFIILTESEVKADDLITL
jgi:hypothetical protein